MELALFVLFFTLVDSFNVDVKNVVNFRGKEGSYFGYSALMFARQDKWVIVGATKANFTNNKDFKSPGNVYKCRLDFTQNVQQECIAMNLEQEDVYAWPDSPGYEEDNELLGASMALIDNKIITCAPLWKNMIPWKSSNLTHPVGRCFNVELTLDSSTTHPFKKNKFVDLTPEGENQFTYEFAQMGFSISNKKYDDPLLDILMGAPGFFENKGGFIQYSDTAAADNFFDSFTHQAFEEDQKKSIQMGTLMGYSITSGRLSDADTSSGCRNVVVLGAPHYHSSDGIVGSVLVVCARADTLGKEIEIKKQFFGSKPGGGFGTSVVFDDINNDGLDDLLVGSPLYYDSKSNVLDVGAVNIYYGKADHTVLLEISSQVLRGSGAEFGRFGTAMECVRDLNKDKFKDLVISAPYEDEQKGAIYIYHGGATELILSQRITAQQIGMQLHSFGWYISAAYDIDHNQYPDFLVGSYMSDTVSVFRTRPIIKITNTFKIEPSVIPLNSSGLQCRDELFRPCVTMHLCFAYTGENVPARIRLTYNMSADILRTRAIPSKISRVDITNQGVNTQTDFIQDTTDVPKGEGKCITFSAIVKVVNREFFAALEEQLVVETKFELSQDPIPGDVLPILDNIPTVKQDAANFSTGCNGTCHPDLQMKAQLDADDVILGETSEIVLSFQISNIGDQSYGTQVVIKFTNNTQYIGFSQPQDEVTQLIACLNMVDSNNVSFVECNVKDILFQQQKVIFKVKFLISTLLIIGDQKLDKFSQSIIFNADARSTSQDVDMSDNIQRLTAMVKLKSNIELTGISVPDQLRIADKTGYLKFTHKYNVLNNGPSPFHTGKVFICLPVRTEDGLSIMLKSGIEVITNDPRISWKIAQFPGEQIYKPTSGTGSTVKSTTKTPISTTTLPPRETPEPSRRKRDTVEPEALIKEDLVVTDIKTKLKMRYISCDTIEPERHSIIELTINSLEVGDGITFEIPVNISGSSLNFHQVSGIVYKTKGNVEPKYNDRFVITVSNATYEVSSEIFPEEITIVPEKVNIWIIIGSCIGGVVLLVAIGIVLWKLGFFKRKKREDVKKWKRQSGYYAKRQSFKAGSTKSSSIKNAEWHHYK